MQHATIENKDDCSMPFKKECKAVDRAGFLQIYSCLCTGSMGFPSQWFVFHAMRDWNRKQRFGTVARSDDAASAGTVEMQEIGFGMAGRRARPTRESLAVL